MGHGVDLWDVPKSVVKVKEWGGGASAFPPVFMDKFVILSIIILPLSAVIPVYGTDIWYVQYLALFSAFALATAVFIFNSSKPLSIFLGLAWYSTIFPAHQHPRAILCLVQVIFSCLAIKVISGFKKETAYKIFCAVFIASLINSFYTVLQYLNLDPIFNSVKNENFDDTVGFLGSHNQLGVFMSVTSPVVMNFFPPAILLNVFAIFCSKTTSSWIAFIVGMVFWGAFNTKQLFKDRIRPFWAISFVVLLASALFFGKIDKFGSSAWGERLNLYRHTIDSVFKEKIFFNIKDNVTKVKQCNMFFGYGLGSFTALSPHAQTGFLLIPGKSSHRYEHAHNDYLETLFEMGVLGFISVLIIVADIFIKFLRSAKTKIIIISFCSLLIHMINSLGIYAVQTAPSGMLLIVFLGIFYGEVIRQKREGVYAR